MDDLSLGLMVARLHNTGGYGLDTVIMTGSGLA